MKIYPKNSSFTLIEMMVVVGVIAILIAIIIPAVTSAKERGRAVRCQGNLKELHAAAMNFAFRDADNYLGQKDLPRSRSLEWYDEPQDRWYNVVGWVDWTTHQRRTPGNRGITKWWGNAAYKSITSTNKGDWWTCTLWDYTGENLKVYSCPTFARTEVAGTTSPNPDNAPLKFNFEITANGVVLRSYGMNSLVSAAHPGGGADSRRLLFADMSEVKTVGSVTIADRHFKENINGNNDDSNNCWHLDGELWAVKNGSYCRESVGSYHNGRGNAVFVDGHVEAIKPLDTWRACSTNW